MRTGENPVALTGCVLSGVRLMNPKNCRGPIGLAENPVRSLFDRMYYVREFYGVLDEENRKNCPRDSFLRISTWPAIDAACSWKTFIWGYDKGKGLSLW